MTGFDLERETQADGARLKTEASHQRTCSFCRTSVPISGICSGCGNRMGLLPSLPEIEAEPPAQPDIDALIDAWIAEEGGPPPLVHRPSFARGYSAGEARIAELEGKANPDIEALLEEWEPNGSSDYAVEMFTALAAPLRGQAKTIERLEFAEPGRGPVEGERFCVSCGGVRGEPWDAKQSEYSHEPECWIKAALEATEGEDDVYNPNEGIPKQVPATEFLMGSRESYDARATEGQS